MLCVQIVRFSGTCTRGSRITNPFCCVRSYLDSTEAHKEIQVVAVPACGMWFDLMVGRAMQMVHNLYVVLLS